MEWKHVTPHFFEKRSDRAATKGCWPWLGYRQSGGYGQIYIKGKWYLAHRMSWVAHNGSIPEGQLVLHKCDRPACVNPDHLFLGSHADNAADCRAKGRAYIQQPGHNFAFTRKSRVNKLTDKQVRYIRASSLKLRELAATFNVSMSTISNTRRGKRKQLIK